MVPTYNRQEYLEQTLQSILIQDPGSDRMQLCVVDNASTTVDVPEIIKRLAGDRIEYIRQPVNIGGIRNINSAINHSRGQWVHVLHDDDLVMPGFYRAYEKAIEKFPHAALIFCPIIRIDDRGVATSLSTFNTAPEGPIADFLVHQATGNHVPTPAVVIPRRIYEQYGAYAEKLSYVPDWEMAFRAGMYGPVVTLAMPYAAMRWHEGSDSSRLIKTTGQIDETKALVDELFGRLSPERQAVIGNKKYAWIANLCEVLANIVIRSGDRAAQINQLTWAYKFQPTPKRLRALWRAKTVRIVRSIIPQKAV